MSKTDLLASTMGADNPAHRPELTLRGALLTVALFVFLVAATVYPTLTAIGLLGVVLGIIGVRWARRRLRHSYGRRRLCLPRTGVCVTL